jgi:hypothetical protein
VGFEIQSQDVGEEEEEKKEEEKRVTHTEIDQHKMFEIVLGLDHFRFFEPVIWGRAYCTSMLHVDIMRAINTGTLWRPSETMRVPIFVTHNFYCVLQLQVSIWIGVRRRREKSMSLQ